jgi:hypothetical protein
MNKKIVVMLAITIMLIAIPFGAYQPSSVQSNVKPIQGAAAPASGWKLNPAFAALEQAPISIIRSKPTPPSAGSPANGPNGFEPQIFGPPGYVCSIPAAGTQCFDGAGDPVAVIGPTGTLYMGMLGFWDGIVTPPVGKTGDNGVFVYRSTNHGVTWAQSQVYEDLFPCCIGGNAPRFNDKDWLAADRSVGNPQSGYLYATWSRFGEGTNAFGTTPSPIRIARSTDGGATWSVNPNPISAQPSLGAQCLVPGPNATDACPSNQFSDVVVGKDGTVYVSWVNYDTPDQTILVFERSIAPGAWPAFGPVHRVATLHAPLFTTLDFRGEEIGGLADQRYRISTYPKLAVDTTSASGPGTTLLYVAYEAFPDQTAYINLGTIGFFGFFGLTGLTTCGPADVANCVGRGSHIYMNISANSGASWAPITNGVPDPTIDQGRDSEGGTPSVADRFFTSIDVGNTTAPGGIYAIWYDSGDDSNELTSHNSLLTLRYATGVEATGDVTFSSGASAPNLALDLRNGPNSGDCISTTCPSLIDQNHEDIYRWTEGMFAGDYIQVAARGLSGADQVYAHYGDDRVLKGGFNQEDNVLDQAAGNGGTVKEAFVFNSDPSFFEQNEESVAIGTAHSGACDILGGTNDYRFRLSALPFAGVGTGFDVQTTPTCTGSTTVTHDGVLFPYDPATIPPPPVSTITVHLRLFSYKTVNVLIQVCTTSACTAGTVAASTTVTLTPPNTPSNTATRVFSVAPGTYFVKISGFSIATQTSGALTVPPPKAVSFNIF